MTRAPAARATSGVPSELKSSTTITSSAKRTDCRHCGRLRLSFFVMMTTDTPRSANAFIALPVVAQGRVEPVPPGELCRPGDAAIAQSGKTGRVGGEQGDDPAGHRLNVALTDEQGSIHWAQDVPGTRNVVGNHGDTCGDLFHHGYAVALDIAGAGPHPDAAQQAGQFRWMEVRDTLRPGCERTQACPDIIGGD